MRKFHLFFSIFYEKICDFVLVVVYIFVDIFHFYLFSGFSSTFFRYFFVFLPFCTYVNMTFLDIVQLFKNIAMAM